MSYFVFKLCKEAGGWEMSPKKDLKLDLEKLADKFERIHVKTGVILVAELDGVRMSIYPSGRVLLYDCDEDRGQEVAAKVYRMISGGSEQRK